MLALLSILQTQRDWPGHVLAERLQVAPRTVRRDVDRLRRLGYEIAAIKGPDGGYRMIAGAALPPLLFDDDQAVALAVALQNAPASGVDMDEAAERALATLRQVLPSRLRHRLDGIRFDRAPGTARSGAPVEPSLLEALSAAVRACKGVRFHYRDEPRRCEPHAVVARGARWYLIGWDPDREDWRIYRIDRMTLRTPGGDAFERRTVPGEDAGSFLAARLKGSAERNVWPCTGIVILELPLASVAPFLDDGSVEELTPGSCRVTVGSWSWAGVLAAVLRFDAPFTLEGPPELVDAGSVAAGRLIAAGPAPLG